MIFVIVKKLGKYKDEEEKEWGKYVGLWCPKFKKAYIPLL